MTSSLTERFQSDPVLRRVLNSTREYAIFMLDPGGHVATWNDGARQIKGYEAEEIVGRHFRVLYVPEDQEAGHPEHNLRMSLKNGEYREERIRMRKDGSTFEADVDISPIHDDEGRHAGFLKVVHDVSERRRLERELLQSRDELEARVGARTSELREANEDLQAFNHTVAHDFRTPIRGLVARCRLVEEDFGDLLPPEGTEQLRGLADNAKRLADLVDDLLEYARLGKTALVRSPVDLSGMVRRVGQEILPDCHGGAARIEVEDGLTAEGDPRLLRLALRNLLENACKYSEGEVRVLFGREIVDGGESAFFVRDDGMGFDMAYAAKLFQPFERLHGRSGVDGTGIGLANVRRVIERHGGRIWAHGEPGVGATFWFTLR